LLPPRALPPTAPPSSLLHQVAFFRTHALVASPHITAHRRSRLSRCHRCLGLSSKNHPSSATELCWLDLLLHRQISSFRSQPRPAASHPPNVESIFIELLTAGHLQHHRQHQNITLHHHLLSICPQLPASAPATARTACPCLPQLLSYLLP
ncbi:hypothetical protein PIB30_030735, partial [Stylosanthes scabra]|nr:hypothetical protein [Stylosanthes scabra]